MTSFLSWILEDAFKLKDCHSLEIPERHLQNCPVGPDTCVSPFTLFTCSLKGTLMRLELLTYFPIILLMMLQLILLPVQLLSWIEWLSAKPLFRGAGARCLCQDVQGVVG